MIPLKDDIPTQRFPILTVLIIVACAVVYFGFEGGALELGTKGNERVVEYGAIPYEVTHPGDDCGEVAGGELACEGQPGVRGQAPDQAPWWVTPFTSMFMHGSLFHLAGNMLFLWIFGNNIEDSMGRARFVAFYLLGGLAALAVQVLVDPSVDGADRGGQRRHRRRARRLRRALPARAGAHRHLHHHLLHRAAATGAARTRPVVPSPAVAGLQPADIRDERRGVAYFAHIGGFLFGLALIRLFADRARDDYEVHRRIPVY